MDIGTRVMLINSSSSNGLTGTIIDKATTETNTIHAIFDTADGRCQNGYGVADIEDSLYPLLCPIKDTESLKVCSCCGVKMPAKSMIYGKNKKYVCISCNETKAYSTKNNLKVHNQKNMEKLMVLNLNVFQTLFKIKWYCVIKFLYSYLW